MVSKQQNYSFIYLLGSDVNWQINMNLAFETISIQRRDEVGRAEQVPEVSSILCSPTTPSRIPHVRAPIALSDDCRSIYKKKATLKKNL